MFVVRGLPVVRCPGCELVSLDPQPGPEDYASFYDQVGQRQDPRIFWTDSATEREAARRYLAALAERGLPDGALLLIAPPGHVFADEAAGAGYEVRRHLSCRDLDDAILAPGEFDAAVMLYQLEKHPEPLRLLERVHAALRPGGALLVSTPSLDAWPARFFRDQWTEWRPENLYYFDTTTLQSILLRAGFADTWVESEQRRYSLSHVHDRAAAFPRSGLTRLIHRAYGAVPPRLRQARVRLTSSGVVATAVRSDRPDRWTCSIIVPAYNERQTFGELMESLLDKDIPGIDKQIVVVESNSGDGTRELALSYQRHPEVEVVLQDRPRGKGNAVRAGFAHARGEIVMIQDADLEYDINDYDSLLEPIRAYRAAFVLGSRHGGHWKMRQFNDQANLALALNMGHLFFTGLMNLLYGQRMSDPFTMYKVFRRDCLYGLAFECDRFDFDHELVIKLVRKGYRPVEIPVNYRSRSFKEGKKVTLVRDPLLWLWVNVRLRFAPLTRQDP
jgi:SAM-dependent methyltransferase